MVCLNLLSWLLLRELTKTLSPLIVSFSRTVIFDNAADGGAKLLFSAGLSTNTSSRPASPLTAARWRLKIMRTHHAKINVLNRANECTRLKLFRMSLAWLHLDASQT